MSAPEPLVLLHGIGSHAQAWDPVVPLLAREREVLALDLPGFGAAPPLSGEEPTPAALARRNLASSPGSDATLRAMHAWQFSGAEHVPQPVTVAWAEKDRLLLPRQAARARALLPSGRHILLAGAGDVPMWDDPELVARAILTTA